LSEYIHKSHNVSLIMYHFVCPAKYRRVIDHLCKLKEKRDVDWWTEREIFKKLRQNSFIADRYLDILEV